MTEKELWEQWAREPFPEADREPNQRALPAPLAGGLENICLTAVWNFY